MLVTKGLKGRGGRGKGRREHCAKEWGRQEGECVDWGTIPLLLSSQKLPPRTHHPAPSPDVEHLSLKDTSPPPTHSGLGEQTERAPGLPSPTSPTGTPGHLPL